MPKAGGGNKSSGTGAGGRSLNAAKRLTNAEGSALVSLTKNSDGSVIKMHNQYGYATGASQETITSLIGKKLIRDVTDPKLQRGYPKRLKPIDKVELTDFGREVRRDFILKLDATSQIG